MIKYKEHIELHKLWDCRAALWDGKVSHHGEFYNVEVMFPRTAHIPIFISTLQLFAKGEDDLRPANTE